MGEDACATGELRPQSLACDHSFNAPEPCKAVLAHRPAGQDTKSQSRRLGEAEPGLFIGF
jgi:hypothetical protein